MAVEFRNGSGCVALIIGCFGVVRSAHAIFSVYGTRVRDQWQQRALGELLVRRLEVAVLEKCADLHADSMEMTLPGGGCHRKVVSLLMYSKCDWRIIHRSKDIVSSDRLRCLLAQNFEVLDDTHAEYSRRDAGTALEPAKVAAAKAMRKAIARAKVKYYVDSPAQSCTYVASDRASLFFFPTQVTQAVAEAVRIADANLDYARSMLSLAEVQSAKEQKGKHRPPDARVAQRQRWAETVERWTFEVDAAWKLQREARSKLRSVDIALRGGQVKFVESNTQGYTIFSRSEHNVRIPSPETVANQVAVWTSVFNSGVDKKSIQPKRGEGGRWQGRKTANPSVDAPSITDMESDVYEWLGPDGLNWLATASGEAGSAQKTVEAHAMLRGVEAAVGANGQYSGKPVRDGGGRFVDATTPQQRPIHADACEPNSHAKDDAPWGDAHLSMIVSLQDGTQLVVYPFDKEGKMVELTLDAGDIVIFRGDLIHSGAAYDTCNISLHLYIDSPRAPHQRDAEATYAVDAKGGAKSHWPISV